MALKLAFVLFLIYGCAYLLRRYSQEGVGEYATKNTFPNFNTPLREWLRPRSHTLSMQNGNPEPDSIRVIHTKKIGPQLRLQLIEVENQRLLLSVSNEGATLLHILPIKETFDETHP